MATLAQAQTLGEINFSFANDFLSSAVSTAAPAASSGGGSVFSLSSVIDNLKAQVPKVLNTAINNQVQKYTAPKVTVPAAKPATPANVQTMAPASAEKPAVAGVPLPLAMGGVAALAFVAAKVGGRRGRAR